jgi:hypothetical protein
MSSGEDARKWRAERDRREPLRPLPPVRDWWEDASNGPPDDEPPRDDAPPNDGDEDKAESGKPVAFMPTPFK